MSGVKLGKVVTGFAALTWKGSDAYDVEIVDYH